MHGLYHLTSVDTTAILSTCLASSLLTLVAFAAHGRLAGSGERPGCLSMIAFVMGWLALLTAILTGVFLVGGRSTR